MNHAPRCPSTFLEIQPGASVLDDGSDGGIAARLLPDEFGPLLKAVGFEGSIAVQARQMMEETK